jgi:hypothetical protein
MAKITLFWLNHTATHGVAKRLSATKINNVAIFYYCAATLLHAYLFVREMCWWLALVEKRCGCGLLLLVNPITVMCYNFTKQLFSLRLPGMTKYCVMRECENIHSWISLSVDLVFSQQDGNYGFKFLKRFLEISSRDLALFSTLTI